MKKPLYFLIALLIFIVQYSEGQETTTNQQDPAPSEASRKIPELQHKDFQFTFFFPPLSTNWVQNSKTVNKVSLNLLIGNAGAVDGVELGGWVNSVNYYAKGFQGAGIGNINGGYLEGAQLAVWIWVWGTNRYT